MIMIIIMINININIIMIPNPMIISVSGKGGRATEAWEKLSVQLALNQGLPDKGSTLTSGKVLSSKSGGKVIKKS